MTILHVRLHLQKVEGIRVDSSSSNISHQLLRLCGAGSDDGRMKDGSASLLLVLGTGSTCWPQLYHDDLTDKNDRNALFMIPGNCRNTS
ncbi:hypothetical protein VFPPC_16191 [Pochonia chlamydosporia 170]|uniref:Uncharacterized protein n=1 Tax=Pochonia chlamydosporia 170 TaxID=1380566 RepID=A0A179FF97_METCM|nr:hypothetical protein VFPPC_16191 [Pochonia chlamydosporia 170]OAQ64275.1 hypothetical protein VFPPC_16191 [Pochonia chlamydosporia 170]